jgi:hypothetical protein
MWNQKNSTTLNGRKPLITNNIMSLKNPFSISWSSRNGFEKEKNSKMAFMVTFYCLVVALLETKVPTIGHSTHFQVD